jgi:hypothetical protein
MAILLPANRFVRNVIKRTYYSPVVMDMFRSYHAIILYKVKNKNCFIAFFECCPNNNCDNKQHNVRSLKFASETSTNLCPFLLYRQVRQAPLNTKC